MRVQSVVGPAGEDIIGLLNAGSGQLIALGTDPVATDPVGSPMALVYNLGPQRVWVRFDGSPAAAPATPSAGSKVACPSFPLEPGAWQTFQTHTDMTLSLLGNTSQVFVMGYKTI